MSPRRVLSPSAFLLAAAIGLAGAATAPAAAAAAYPSTAAAIKQALETARPGDRVVVAAGTINVNALDVPAGVVLAGQDTDGDGRSNTILQLPPGTSGFNDEQDPRWGSSYVVRLNGTGAGLDTVVVNGNKAAQGPLGSIGGSGRDQAPRPYRGVRAPVEVYCDSCSVTNSVVGNGIFDGIEIRGNDALVSNTEVHTPGSAGVYIGAGTSSDRVVTGTRILDTKINRTGEWYRTVGWEDAGAGPAVGGSLVSHALIQKLTAEQTNGDGVALYASPRNTDITVRDSTFRNNRNHCVHLGADRAIMLSNECYEPGNNGFFLRSNHRDPLVRLSGGRIIDNEVARAKSAAVAVQGVRADTAVNRNRLNGGSALALFTNITTGGLAVGGNTFTPYTGHRQGKTRCQVITAAVSPGGITYSSANPNVFNDQGVPRFCVEEEQAARE